MHAPYSMTAPCSAGEAMALEVHLLRHQRTNASNPLVPASVTAAVCGTTGQSYAGEATTTASRSHH